MSRISPSSSRCFACLRSGGWAVASVLVAGLAAEVFLRLLLPVETIFETWFTPGIQVYDERYNVVYQPGWEGLMRHEDRVQRGVPLVLDEHAFRLPVRAGEERPGALFRVALIGGGSAMMAYGVEDARSTTAAFAARLSERLNRPVEVRNTAWTGVSLHRNWNLFRERLGPTVPFDAAVVSHVNPDFSSLRDPAQWNVVTPWGSEADFFPYLPGIVLWPDRWIAAVGAPAYRSYLGYGWLRLGVSLRQGVEQHILGAESPHDRAVRTQSAPVPADDLAAYRDFLGMIEGWFGERGATTFFALIPRRHFGLEVHDPYAAVLPEDGRVVNLHRELYADLGRPENFLAGHHYADAFAEKVGATLAEHVANQLAATAQTKEAP